VKCHLHLCLDCHRAAVLGAQECLESLGEYLAVWNARLADWPRYVPSTCAEFYALEIIKTISSFHQNCNGYLNSLSNESSPRHTP
jgi:hypothetical protein